MDSGRKAKRQTVFLSAMINLSQNQPGWLSEPPDIETASDDYARRFAGPVGEWMLKVQGKIVLELLRNTGATTVLDVGGGHGQLALPLCHAGYSVTVAGSADACGRNVARLAEMGMCRFQVADLLQLPYSQQSFDAVICVRLVTHCPRWELLLAELCRVARKAVIADYPTSQSLNFAAGSLFAAKKKLEGNTRNFRLFRHDEISRVFAAHGFSIDARLGQFFLPMVLHRCLGRRNLSAWLEGLCRRIGLVQRWGSPVIVKALRL